MYVLAAGNVIEELAITTITNLLNGSQQFITERKRGAMKLFSGIAQLIESPSSCFALLTLFIVSFVSWKQPSLGSGALIAFCSIVPALLCVAENRETLQQMKQDALNAVGSLINPAKPSPPDPKV
jgi:hypothetical protein